MEVHAALGASGRARGEGDQRHVVGGGLHRREGLRMPLGQAQQVVRVRAAVRGDPQTRHPRLHQVVHDLRVAQGVAHPGHRADRGQLLRTLLGQDGDGHRARLHHRQPARGEPGAGRAAQEHPVAGDHAEVAGEDVREPVHAGVQLPVRPHRAVRAAEGGPVGAQPGDGGVEQLHAAVEPVGVGQGGEFEEEPRPGVRGRQVVAREGVSVSGRLELQGGFAPLRRPAPRVGAGPCVWTVDRSGRAGPCERSTSVSSW